MASWRLNGSLTRFREAVNQAYPDRDKTTDGTIGDPAHQARDSDHNPDPDGTVDAWDMDRDLNGKGKPYAADIEKLKRVFQAHPAARYWIHNDQIAHVRDGWVRRPYNPNDPDRNKHLEHVHWNTNQATENSTAPWIIPGAEEDELDATQAKQLRDTHFTTAQAIPNPTGEGRVPLHVWAAWMTNAIKALTAAVTSVAANVGDRDAVTDLANEMGALAADVNRFAEEERQRDAAAATERAELRRLLDELDAGTLTQDELVSRIRISVTADQPSDQGDDAQ
jgi:HAMP domain-containing protein